ncbi:MAG TPA: putative ABC exporter domain-containing protein [Thermoanaerobaculia bacterium]|nr:putative ABC exporter domain-containing protein [Thermoanaerobaculia bacterium]
MIRAFAFVTATTFKNRILVRLRRLRNPRYLVSAIAGLAYLWFFAFRHTARAPRPNFGSDLGIDIISIVVLSMMVLVWAFPGQSGGLEFSEAEIQFLFPAPVSRRQLLLYKLMRTLPQLLITTSVMAFILRRGNFPGLFLAFATLNIYFMMVALARARLKLRGIGFFWRLFAVIAVLAAISWAVTLDLRGRHLDRELATAMKSQRQARIVRLADTPFHGPVVRTMLFVPRFFSAAAFAKAPGPFAVNGAALVGLAAVFFLIAGRLNVSFEEASIAASARRTARNAGRRIQQPGTRVMFRRMPPPFRLRDGAGPEMAIFWKNLIAALRISAAWMVGIVVLAAYFAAQIVFSREPGIRLTFATMELFMAAMFPLIGTVWFPQDLRLDLPRIEVLKSYPISGERLVAAEMAAPLVIISLIELLLLGFASTLLHVFDTGGPLAFFASPQYVVVALLFAVPICGAQLVIRNALPVLLPAWAFRSKDEPRGFVMMGQRLLLMLGNLLVLGLALIPAALLFLPALWMAHRFFAGSPVVLAVATVPSVALLVAEVWVGVRFLGAQFDRIDVTNDLDPMVT